MNIIPTFAFVRYTNCWKLDGYALHVKMTGHSNKLSLVFDTIEKVNVRFIYGSHMDSIPTKHKKSSGKEVH